MSEGGNDPFKEFIDQMGELGLLSSERSQSEITEMVDDALTRWIAEQCDDEFESDPKFRDLMTQMLKKSHEIEIKDPEYVYIDAILMDAWRNLWLFVAKQARKNGNPLNVHRVALYALRSAFIMGMAYGEMNIPLAKTYPRDPPETQ